eukprot:1151812-Pelagomonas_calceolata.AAC.4
MGTRMSAHADTVMLVRMRIHTFTHMHHTQSKCHPQTIEVCKTRADGLGLEAVVQDEASFTLDKDVCGLLVQYPATDGSIESYKDLADAAHAANIRVRGELDNDVRPAGAVPCTHSISYTRVSQR